jgi:two-component sensor histidine kinase
VLAVVKALLRLSRRDDPVRFAETVEGRIDALARAHTLLAQNRWTGADMRTLAAEELAAYAGRVGITGPAVRLAADAAQPVGMVLHELATNAAKHGALSVPLGRVDLGWTLVPGEGLRLVWSESGGPVPKPAAAGGPAAPPAPRPSGAAAAVPSGGFGSRLIQQTVRHQIGGTVTMEWLPTGLRCTVTVPARRLLLAEIPAPPAPSFAPMASGMNRPVSVVASRPD